MAPATDIGPVAFTRPGGVPEGCYRRKRPSYATPHATSKSAYSPTIR